MTTLRTEHYSGISSEHLSKARFYLDEGDLLQASEKGWGAAAVAVKACAESREMLHSAHWHLHRVVDVLVDETGDTELGRQFGLASQLHANFYEGALSRERVSDYLEAVERFVASVGEPVAE